MNATLAIYQLQALMLKGDAAALAERARRYASTEHPSYLPRAHAKLAAAWLDGYEGRPNRYAHGRGGNFARPFYHAYRDGANERRMLAAEAPA